MADLGDRLETRKAVDRAKGVLMAKLKITEADAFRWIQKTAYEIIAGDWSSDVCSSDLAMALDLKPDIVIMDVKMPVMDGITAAEQIGKERICPVVMLTAFSQKELVDRKSTRLNSSHRL